MDESFIIPYFQVVSYAFLRLKKTDTTCSPFKNPILTIVSKHLCRTATQLPLLLRTFLTHLTYRFFLQVFRYDDIVIVPPLFIPISILRGFKVPDEAPEPFVKFYDYIFILRGGQGYENIK